MSSAVLPLIVTVAYLTLLIVTLGSHSLARFIPGNPAIIVRTMLGNDGVIAYGYMTNVAKADGLTTAVVGFPTASRNQFLGIVPDIKFDLTKMRHILVLPGASIMLAKHGLISQPKDIATVASKLSFADTEAATGLDVLLVLDALKLNFGKVYFGFPGSAEKRLAFLKGEINFVRESTTGYFSAFKSYFDRGEVDLVMGTGYLDSKGNLVRDSAMPDLPTAKEVYEQIYGKAPSGDAWDAYMASMAMLGISRTVALAPTTPDDVFKILQAAAEKMAQDADFKKALALIDPGHALMVRQEAEAAVMQLRDKITPKSRQYIRDLLTNKYGMKLY